MKERKPQSELENRTWTASPFLSTCEKSLLIEKQANHHFELLSPCRWHQEITYSKMVLYCESLSNQPRFFCNLLFYLIAKLQKELNLPVSAILESPDSDEPHSQSKFLLTITTTCINWLIQEFYKMLFLFGLMKRRHKNHSCIGLERIYFTFIAIGNFIW